MNMKEESNPHSELRASATRTSAGDGGEQRWAVTVHTAPCSRQPADAGADGVGEGESTVTVITRAGQREVIKAKPNLKKAEPKTPGRGVQPKAQGQPPL